jgi:hypothetical protein
MGKRGTHMGFRRESHEERDQYEDLDVGGRILHEVLEEKEKRKWNDNE